MDIDWAASNKSTVKICTKISRLSPNVPWNSYGARQESWQWPVSICAIVEDSQEEAASPHATFQGSGYPGKDAWEAWEKSPLKSASKRERSILTLSILILNVNPFCS